VTCIELRDVLSTHRSGNKD